MKNEDRMERNDANVVNHECVTSQPSRVELRPNPLPLASRLWNGPSRLGASFSWRCFELFNLGFNTKEIAEIVEKEIVRLPGKKKAVTEGRVYNALNKARNDIYERGLTFPRVKAVGTNTTTTGE